MIKAHRISLDMSKYTTCVATFLFGAMTSVKAIIRAMGVVREVSGENGDNVHSVLPTCSGYPFLSWSCLVFLRLCLLLSLSLFPLSDVAASDVTSDAAAVDSR